MALIKLGNTKVIEPVKPDSGKDTVELKKRADLGQRTHHIGIPEGMGFEEGMGHIRRFVDTSFGEPPAWVESDDEIYQKAIAQQYGCREGEPKNWKEGK